MHSIDVTETWEDEFKESHVSIIIKTLYSIKLKYPEGIEIDIPRTYRSVYKFKFRINSDTRVFAEHWGWLIDAITKNYDYRIIFNHTDSESSVQVKDGALIFTVYNEGAEAYHYLPLEYHRDDAIEMCRQIQAIYVRHSDTIQFHRYRPDILALPPTQFPLVRVVPSMRLEMIEIQYYCDYSSKYTCNIQATDREALRNWLGTVSHDPDTRTRFSSGSTELKDVTYGISVATGWTFWSLSPLDIPKLIAALA
jgi:hypothetical protein